MKYSISGVILAGGGNSRFYGKNKAFININGNSIIENTYFLFKKLFKEIIIVTNEPEKYIDMDVTIVSDIFSVRSSLTGIHAALFYSCFPFAFIAACDMPFLKENVIEAIINGIKPEFSVIIPETSAGLEPLSAVYSKKCLPLIENRIKTNKLSIRGLLDKVKTKRINEKTLRKYDKELVSFFNINSPDELAKASMFCNKIF